MLPPAITYAERISRLERRNIYPHKPPDLEGPRQALRAIYGELDSTTGFPAHLLGFIPPQRIVLVAGTNGKGSVVASLSALLQAGGYRVATYTSPHLVRTEERFRIQDEPISPTLFGEIYDGLATHPATQTLTHFEFLTFMAIELFLRQAARFNLDYVIFEVGLGGLWDATNLIPHATSVITSLSLDHQAILGPNLGQIAANKFGIIRPFNQVVHAPLPEEVREVALQFAQATHSRWIEAAEPQYWIDAPDWVARNDANLAARGSGCALPEEPITYFRPFVGGLNQEPVALTLPGRRGAQNAQIALTIAEVLGLDVLPIIPALTRVRWPGRMERMPTSQLRAGYLYLSGDHNPAGMQSLLEILQHYSRQTLYMLAAISAGKDLDAILEPLRALSQSTSLRLSLCPTPFRPRPLDDYAPYASWARIHAHPKAAMQEICQESQVSDLVVITGSLYLVGWATTWAHPSSSD